MSRVVDVFLSYLEAEGATVVFGIPGGLLHPFFEAVENDARFRLVVTKHEEAAAFMADGFSRLSGRIAVCAATAGPGATNLLTGVSCAFADGVPLLVITGQAASSAIGKGAAQETGREDIDIVAMFRPVTKYSAMVTSVATFSGHLRRALRFALTGRHAPVHLNLPVDLWEHPLEEEWFEPRSYRPITQTFDRRNVALAGDALLRATKPVLLAGSGLAAARAERHLASLAEMLPARVATTPRGKGLLPEDHPLSLGVLGFAGHKEARETILSDEIDVLFTVGASLNETTTFNWHPGLRPKGTLIQLDIDADRIGRNYPVDVPLVGDAHSILTEIVYHMHRAIRDGERPQSVWANAPPLTRGLGRYSDPELRASDATPVTPQRWRADLEEVLPSDAVVFSDIGAHMLFNIHHLCIRGAQRFVLNLGFGSVGHGTAAAIGAALGEPHTPIVAIVGDAGFTMNGMELLTAREYEVPVVWIVENNNMHGITWFGSKLVGSRRPLESIRYKHPLDIAGIARAMGLAEWRIERPGEMQGVFMKALALGGPAVIEVRVNADIEPPIGERARSVAGFIRSRDL